MDNEIALYVVLGGFYVLVLPALVIFALVRMARLNGEVEELRRAYRLLIARLPTAATPSLPSSVVTLSEAKSPVPSQTPPALTQDTPLRSAPQEIKRVTIEQLLGGRALAWVGAAAVTLAGIFLVKYSIDQGWLDPTARILAAAMLGAIFVGAGELLRSRDARIAQAASAAGVAVLYAALFAAVTLYGLVPRSLGIVLAALLTALSIALSLRQGPFVALLGLIGGALAPALISQHTNDPLILFSYLLALIGGVAILLRWKGWWWLGWCALVVGALWAGLWVMVGYSADGMYWVGLFILAIGALFVWIAHRMDGIGDDVQTALSWTALGLMSALAALLVSHSNYQFFPWAVFLSLGALVFFQARRFADEWQWLGLITPVLSLLVFWYWGQWIFPGHDDYRFALTAAIVGGLISLGAYALLWRAKWPVFWAALSVGSAAMHFAVVCGYLFRNPLGLSWGYVSLLLALSFALGALPAARARQNPGTANALSVLIVGVVVFVSAAVPLELRREWITMCYALELPVVMFTAWRWRLPLLRFLAWLLMATVTIRLVFNPYVLDYDVSASPLLNWVLYGYGVAIACYWLAANLLKRMTSDWIDLWLLRAIAASMLAFGFLLLTLEVRSFFHPEGLGHSIDSIQDSELYAYSIVWLLFGAALLLGGIVQRSTMLRYASLIVLVLVVGKVFVIDMSGLTGLLRVASFLGLGIGLLALGFIYRRYVFADDRAAIGAG